jgi:formiminoglutamase
VRQALGRFSTFDWTSQTDLRDVIDIVDRGDIENPDDPDGTRRVSAAAGDRDQDGIAMFLGGDNAALYAGMTAVAGGELPDWGLVTFDAHHDVRDGRSNGSPVRQLLDDGLDGRHVVQVGISDFANSPAYAGRVVRAGITVIPRSQWRRRSASTIVSRALDVAGADGRPVYVDVDVDVVDRAIAPGCPASVPGGLSADEIREAVRCICKDDRVKAIDFTEVDVDRDASDGRTIRLVALLLLEACAGLADRTAR